MAASKQYVPQSTLQYVTFVKRNIVEALQDAFKDHPDRRVADTRVAIDFGHDRWKLPGVIVMFYEREIKNAGVGHVEALPWTDNPTPDKPQYIKYYHRLYKGDIAFDVYGQSAVDRDLVRDALIEVLTMQEVTTGGNAFIQRLYWHQNQTPYGNWHYPVLNLDVITGYGEQNTIAPWSPEDYLVYKASYRVPIFGEFYSNTPHDSPIGTVDRVNVYPYLSDEAWNPLEPTPDDNPDPGPYPDYPDPLPPDTTLPIAPVDGWYHFGYEPH